MSTRLVHALFVAFPLSACAAEGGGEGGADNLPDRGIAGWSATGDAETPFVLGGDGARLASPSAIVVGDRVRVYAQRESDDGPVLVMAEGDGIDFAAPTELGLAGRDPSVTLSDGLFWLTFVGDDDAIAIATSSDGLAFERLAPTGLAPERTAPSLVIDGDALHLYLSTGTTLVHTEAPRATLAFGPETEVLAPGVDCLGRDGEPEPCWDRGAIVEAEVRLARSGAGTPVYRMFYAARAQPQGASDVGFAASYDGLSFSRYAFNPVIDVTFDMGSPTSVLFDEVYLLYWSERRTTALGGIAGALHEPSAPADRW